MRERLLFFALLSSLAIFCAATFMKAQIAGTTLTNGSGVPTGSCVSGSSYVDSLTGHYWTCVSGSWVDSATFSAGLPSGMIAFIDTGTCPSGWTQEASGGNYLLLTLAANSDVGTTGGSNSYTPAGTVAAPTFTGTPFSSVINHTHTVTVTYNVQGGTTAATTGTHVMTSTATGGSARAPTSGDVVSATTSNPAGGVSSITPAGTNSAPSFTGTGATIQPTFLKVIGCKKN